MAKMIVFNLQGEHLFSIDEKGTGPGEYLEIKNFTVDDRFIYIIDNFSHKLMAYSLTDGSFVFDNPMPVVAWDLEKLTNGGFVFVVSPLRAGEFSVQQSNHKVFITDDELNITNRFVAYGEDEVDPVGKSSFLTHSGNAIVFHTSGSDIVYMFSKDNGELLSGVYVDLGSHKIPEKYRDNDEKITANKYNYIHSTPLICGKYLWLDVCIDGSFSSFLYDMSRETLAANSTETGVKYFLNPLCADKRSYISLLTSYEFYEELVEVGFERAPSAIEKHLANDGYVLLFYEMI